MPTMIRRTLFLAVLAIALMAQTGSLSVSNGVIDFSSVSGATKLFQAGNALPGTCAVQSLFWRTADNTLWFCSAVNTFTQFGSAGGSGTINTGGAGRVAYYSTSPTGTTLDASGSGVINTVLHSQGSLQPTFSQVTNLDIANNTIDLTAKVTGVLPSANSQPHSITFIIDGGGSVIATGDAKIYPTADFSCTINRIDISADKSGSATVDVWKAAGAIPTSGNKISASAPLTLSSAQLSQAGSLTGWSTSVSVGDVFGFNVATAATVTRIMGQIWCQ